MDLSYSYFLTFKMAKWNEIAGGVEPSVFAVLAIYWQCAFDARRATGG
jgi:hypothetical protein